MASHESAGDLLALQQRIAARVRHGGSALEVEREIIRPSGVAEMQLPALRLYTRAQLRLHRLRHSVAPGEAG
jgi:hypothetical protein